MLHSRPSSLLEDNILDLTRYADLDDGTFLAVTSADDMRCLVVRLSQDRLVAPTEKDASQWSHEAGSRLHGTSERTTDVHIIAHSLVEAISEVLTTGGAPSFPSRGLLHDAIPAWLRTPRPPRPPREARKPRRPKRV